MDLCFVNLSYSSCYIDWNSNSLFDMLKCYHTFLVGLVSPWTLSCKIIDESLSYPIRFSTVTVSNIFFLLFFFGFFCLSLFLFHFFCFALLCFALCVCVCVIFWYKKIYILIQIQLCGWESDKNTSPSWFSETRLLLF